MNFATQQLNSSYISAITTECADKEEECLALASDDQCQRGCANCPARGASVEFWTHLDRVGKVLTKAGGDESRCFADSTGVYTSNPSFKEGKKVFKIHADARGNLSYKEV